MPEPKRGPEKDARDRGRQKRLDKQVHDAMGSQRFIDALEEARTDPGALGELKANPKAFLKGKGVGIPDEDEIEIEFTEENSWSVCWCYYWWYYRYCCCYHYYW